MNARINSHLRKIAFLAILGCLHFSCNGMDEERALEEVKSQCSLVNQKSAHLGAECENALWSAFSFHHSIKDGLSVDKQRLILEGLQTILAYPVVFFKNETVFNLGTPVPDFFNTLAFELDDRHAALELPEDWINEPMYWLIQAEVRKIAYQEPSAEIPEGVYSSMQLWRNRLYLMDLFFKHSAIERAEHLFHEVLHGMFEDVQKAHVPCLHVPNSGYLSCDEGLNSPYGGSALLFYGVANASFVAKNFPFNSNEQHRLFESACKVYLEHINDLPARLRPLSPMKDKDSFRVFRNQVCEQLVNEWLESSKILTR